MKSSFKWPLTRKFAWYNQERARGTYLVSFSPEAGWTFSTYYRVEEGLPVHTGSYRKYTPAEADAIPASDLMTHPFFKGFRDEGIYGEGGSAYIQTNDMVRWHALSHGIPAESFAAGANPVPKWGEKRNIDMAFDCKPIEDNDGSGETSNPEEDGTEEEAVESVNWIHSYFIQNSLFETRVLYEKLVNEIKNTNHEGASE